MPKLLAHLRSNLVGYVALFFALGLGTAWAATELQRNEVKSKHIAPGQVKNSDLADDAVTSPKVDDGSLHDDDFAKGELPQGPRGPRGEQGETGDAGPPGPDTLSFDIQVDRDGIYHNLTEFNGLQALIRCAPAAVDDSVDLLVVGATEGAPFHGWGTAWNGSSLQRANRVDDALVVNGIGTADLDVVAQASATLDKYTVFHVNGVVGTKCNFHVLVIPPA